MMVGGLLYLYIYDLRGAGAGKIFLVIHKNDNKASLLFWNLYFIAQMQFCTLKLSFALTFGFRFFLGS